MNITDPIRRHAALTPRHLAVIRPDGRGITYRDFDRTIDAIARRIVALDLRPGQTVATATSASYRSIVLMLALARLGIVSAPLTLPAEFVDVSLVDGAAAQPASGNVVAIDRVWTGAVGAAFDARPMASHQDGAALCRIFASSGTTGSPKHVALSHDLLAERLLRKLLAVRPPDDTRQLSTIGAGTAYGFLNLLRVLWTGGTLVLHNVRISIAELMDCIERHQVNFMVTTPSALTEILASMPPGVGPLPSLHAIEVSGSALPTRLYETTRQRLCSRIISLYGATESSSIASAPMAMLHGHANAVGYIHPDTEVQAVDDHDVPVPPDAEGVLRVRGRLCVTSYFGDAAVSASVFKGGWFYPGDIGSVSRNGLLRVTGRVGDRINRGGAKVSPQLIEAVLSTVPGVREVAAFGVPDTMGVAQIWAAIVSDGTVDMAALRALCATQLGDKAPKHFLHLDELPRNEAGKLLRKQLPAIALRDAD